MAISLADVAAGFGETLAPTFARDQQRQQADRQFGLAQQQFGLAEEQLGLEKVKIKQGETKMLADALGKITDQVTADTKRLIEQAGAIAAAPPTPRRDAALSQIRQNILQSNTDLVKAYAAYNLPAPSSVSATSALTQFEAALAAATTPEEAGTMAGQSEAAKQKEVSLQLGPEWSPPTMDKQGNVIQQKRDGQVNVLAAADKPGEFERLLASVPPDQREQFKLARLEKLVESSGFSLSVGADGQVSLTQGRVPAPGGNQQQEVRLEAQSLDNLIADVKNLMTAQKDGKINLGLSGTVARGARETVNILGDVQSMVPGMAGVNERANAVVKSLLGNDSSVMDQLRKDDPKIGELSPLETALGVAMARLNQPTGRMLADVLKPSMQDAKLTGLRSEQQVVERLNYIMGRLEQRRANLGKEMGEAPKSAPAKPAEAAPPSLNTPGAAASKTMRAIRDPNAPGGFRLEAQ